MAHQTPGDETRPWLDTRILAAIEAGTDDAPRPGITTYRTDASGNDRWRARAGQVARLLAEAKPAPGPGSDLCPCGEEFDSAGECYGSWHGCEYHNDGPEPEAADWEAGS
jgi:hypothetical protein